MTIKVQPKVKKPAKAKKDTKLPYTHISVILDRSGSMSGLLKETIGGFNTFLKEQQAIDGKATLTLVQFDSGNPYEVIHDFMPIKEVPELTETTYVPRGYTPLLDAIGRGINDVVDKTAKMDEAPEKIMFIIITDGQENSSHEFSKAQVKKMIDDKTAEKWDFVYLSSDFASIGDAQSYGVSAVNTACYSKSADGTKDMFADASTRAFTCRTSK